jgi:hypothetical protein
MHQSQKKKNIEVTKMHFATYLILFLLVGASIAIYVSWSHGLLVFPSWTGIPTQPMSKNGEGFRVSGKKKSRKEKFDGSSTQNTSSSSSSSPTPPPPPPPLQPQDPAVIAANEQAAYNSRIYVMQVFEAVLHRKPTNTEIVKYSAYGPSQSKILAAIVQDNPTTQSPDGCEDPSDSCALPVLAGSNEEACDGDDDDSSSSSSSSSDSESDSDSDDGLPTNEWKIPKKPIEIKLPRPFAPSGRVIFDKPDLDIKVYKTMGTPQPCLDRMDVLKRLQTISDDVENFKKYITML